MTRRERIYQKFNGLCAYSGTPLEDDWEMDHMEPVIRHLVTGKPWFPDCDNEDNLVPCQKLINRYKANWSPSDLKYHLGKFHIQISKLPKNPKTDFSIRRKARFLKIASYFKIDQETPFSGKFFFEQFQK
mgnify:CR=1 FL=1